MIRAYANSYWTLERDTSQLLLVVRRTEERYQRIAEIGASFRELEQALNAYNRKHFRLLVDMRSAPQRNDPEFEKEAEGQPIALSRDFARVAVMVRTASGMLQVGRHIRSHAIPMELFTDEDEALRYLSAARA